jgi:hypothetical protein
MPQPDRGALGRQRLTRFGLSGSAAAPALRATFLRLFKTYKIDCAERRAPTTFGSGYWLRHCEGYRIRTPLGYEGFVEDVMLDECHERPQLLSVRSCRRLICVEAEEIDLVLPGSETIVLRRALARSTAGSAQAKAEEGVVRSGGPSG